MDSPNKAIEEALSQPFLESEVKFRPASVSGNRCLALPYVDARVIQDRLDEVLGVTGWQDEYECLPDGSVVCRLRLKIGDEWIVKMDVGSESEQPDKGDKRKAAFSDALKRAAVKFGLGRYLYRCGQLWADYDPQKKRIVTPPKLPAGAAARKKTAPAAQSGKPAETISAAHHEQLKAALAAAGREWGKSLVWAGLAEDTDWDRIPLSAFRKIMDACEKAAKPAPAAPPPAQTPAPAQGGQHAEPSPDEEPENDGQGPDPAEQIGEPEVRQIQVLLKESNTVWARAVQWLNANLDAGWETSTAKVRDLTFGQFWRLADALERKAAETKGKQPAKAG